MKFSERAPRGCQLKELTEVFSLGDVSFGLPLAQRHLCRIFGVVEDGGRVGVVTTKEKEQTDLLGGHFPSVVRVGVGA